jgi:hypothetical protein
MYEYLINVSSILRSDIDQQDFGDSLSRTQYVSKKWLIDSLAGQRYRQNPSVLVLGGWYGSYVIPMLNEIIQPSRIYFNDINERCLEVAKRLHRQPNISFHHFDATTAYKHFNADIVINTSCEHMSDYTEMLKEGSQCLYVLQTCDNKNDPGHINVSTSTNEFLQKLNLSSVMFAARRDIGHKKRFLVIGQK